MTTPTTTIATTAPTPGATHSNPALHLDFNHRPVVSRSRPSVALAPRPAPAPTDPTSAVVAAFLTGDHPYKSVSDIVEVTGLKRGTVISTIAALATAGRAERVVNDLDDAIIIRWILKR